MRAGRLGEIDGEGSRFINIKLWLILPRYYERMFSMHLFSSVGSTCYCLCYRGPGKRSVTQVQTVIIKW